MGGVSYIDYQNDFIDPINGLNFFAYKSRYYCPEQEIRAVVWGNERASRFKSIGDIGIEVPIDLASTIERVYVNPNAKNNYEQAVAARLLSTGLHIPVVRSSLTI